MWSHFLHISCKKGAALGKDKLQTWIGIYSSQECFVFSSHHASSKSLKLLVNTAGLNLSLRLCLDESSPTKNGKVFPLYL